MKLPQERSERIKLFSLVGVVAVLLLYVAISMAVQPMLKTKAERLTQIESLKAELETARRVIDFVDRNRETNRQTVSEIVQIAETSNCVLRARLGNYLLVATEIIERAARDAGVPVSSVKEVSLGDFPTPVKDAGPGVFRLYTARVELQCGTHDLIRLLHRIESGNPYLCISSMGIAARPESPAVHEVMFDVQWPVWKDENHLASMTKTLELTEAP